MTPMSSSGTIRPGLNNFDLLRLVFALMVCLVHAHELSGEPALRFISDAVSSAVAVKCFFVVSGFLIFSSYDRSRSLRDYVSKRLRRIYPAYIFVVLACALALPWLFRAEGATYFNLAWYRYIVANALFLNFLQPGLPDVFATHRSQAVNGALWTLKIEVMFYIAVPLIAALMARLGRALVIATIYLLSVAYSISMLYGAEQTQSEVWRELARQLPGQLSYFMAGAYFCYFFDFFRRNIRSFAALSILILLIDRNIELPVLEPFALASVVMTLAYAQYLGNFAKYGDVSYGLYIVHFPVIQLLLWSGAFSSRPQIFLVVAVLLSLALAVPLWHGIEKHFLSRGNHYRSTDNPAHAVSRQG